MARGGAVEARRAHNPKVVGSNPTPATKLKIKAGEAQGQKDERASLLFLITPPGANSQVGGTDLILPSAPDILLK